MIRLFRSATLIIGLCALAPVAAGMAAQDAAATAVKAAIDELLSKKTAQYGLNKLREYPADLVVPALIDRVLAPSGVDPLSKSFAYELLFDLHAEESDAGFRALMAGINEEAGRDLCIKSLGRIQGERRAIAAARISGLLGESTLPERTRANIMRALGHLRVLEPGAREKALETVFDPKVGQDARDAAAGALVLADASIGALADLTLAPADDGKEIALIRALSHLVTQKNPVLDVPVRETIQAYVIRMLDHPKSSVRATALDQGVLVFGDDAITKEGSAHVVRPDLRVALLRVRDGDPESALRMRAMKTLDVLEQAVLTQSPGPR